MIEWADLSHKLTRQRNKPTRSERRESIDDWTKDVQPFQGLIQPKRGKLSEQPEGALSETTDVMRCNFTTQKVKGEPIDIQVNDRIVQAALSPGKDAPPRLYRVLFVADAGGQGDHLKIYLKTVGPNGD